MASLNKVTLIGNLGADPEIKYSTNGTAIATLSLAVRRPYVNKATNQHDTDWFQLTAFGKQAETLGQYAHKGDGLYFEARLEPQKWTDTQGVTQYRMAINVDGFQFLSKAGGSREAGAPSNAGDASTPPREHAPGISNALDDLDDDIPF